MHRYKSNFVKNTYRTVPVIGLDKKKQQNYTKQIICYKGTLCTDTGTQQTDAALGLLVPH